MYPLSLCVRLDPQGAISFHRRRILPPLTVLVPVLSEFHHKWFSFTVREVSLSGLSSKRAPACPGLAEVLGWPGPNRKDRFYAATHSSAV